MLVQALTQPHGLPLRRLRARLRGLQVAFEVLRRGGLLPRRQVGRLGFLALLRHVHPDGLQTRLERVCCALGGVSLGEGRSELLL